MFDGSAPFYQSGWVVTDIDESITAWIAKGGGPFYVRRTLRRLPCRYRGSASLIDLSIAWGQVGGMQIELIQQLSDEQSCYRDSFPRGIPAAAGGFHHLAMQNADFDRAYAACIGDGYVEAQSGVFDGTRVSYFDTRPQYGFMIEITEVSPSIAALNEMVSEAARGWNGTAPVREI